MSRINKLCLLAALILSFVLSQTPAQAVVAQQNQSGKLPTAQLIETVAARLSKCPGQDPNQLNDDLKLLTPEEVSMLSANPRMMHVGGHHWDGDDRALNVALIIVAAVLVVAIVVVVAVAVSCN